MALRGHIDGRAIQAPGLMRHGPFPAVGHPGRQHLEPSPALEIMENKVAVQAAEIEKLIRENQRLAASHVTLRQDIVNTENEMQMIRTHLGGVQSESDIQMRDLMERIRTMEADICPADALKMELQQGHMEAKGLIAAREELTAKIQQVTKELQKISHDNKSMPDLYAELDGLRQEHQRLRSAFEYEKNSNIKQVEQMRTMEMNLITMAKEADKLRAEVANAEKRAQAAQTAAAQAAAAQAAAVQAAAAQAGATQPAVVSAATNPYGNAYASLPTAYQQATQAGTYSYAVSYENPAASYQHAVQASGYGSYAGYPVAGYAQSALSSYPGAYVAPQQTISSGAATDVANLYSGVSSGGYPGGLVATSGGATAIGQAADPYSGAYDTTRGVQR